MSASTASTTNIRALFPALARQRNGVPVAFLDGPRGTQVPQSVVDALGNYLVHHNANTHWNHPSSKGLVRVGRAFFTTPDEVQCLIDGVREVTSNR